MPKRNPYRGAAKVGERVGLAILFGALIALFLMWVITPAISYGFTWWSWFIGPGIALAIFGLGVILVAILVAIEDAWKRAEQKWKEKNNA